MPTFPRLGRHSNRSQNALADPPAAPIAAAAAGGGTGDAASNPGQQVQQPKSPDQSQSHNLSRNLNSGAPGQSQSQSQSQSQVLADSPAHNTNPPISSNPAFSSSDSSFVDARLPPPPVPATGGGGAAQPPQHQHQLYIGDTSPDTAATDSPVFDNRRHPELVEVAVNRSQSQRYSTYAALPHQQHLQQQQQQFRHQVYRTGSASFEDLSSTTGYPPVPVPQSAPAPEKKSRRKIIKGIFSSSSRSHNDNQQQQQSQRGPPRPQQLPQGQPQGHPLQNFYDNTSGLARRPSKRVSNPPIVNTRLSQQPHQFASDSDWHAQGSYSLETSPLQGLGEVDEYQYTGPDSNRDFQSQESQTSLNTTIQQVANDPESSPYDEVTYHQSVPQQKQQQQAPPPHQPQQQQLEQLAPPSQPHVHQHDQTHRQDQAPSYAQQPPHGHPQQQQQQRQDQFQYTAALKPTPYQQVGEPRLVTSHLGAPQQPPPQQQNAETVSQVSHESPLTDADQRSSSQQSAQVSPAANYTAQSQDLAPTPNPPSSQLVSPQQQPSMAPPSGGPPPNKSQLRGQAEPPAGPPPGYRHSNSSVGALNPPQPGQPGSQNPAFRGEGVPRFESPGIDQDRNSPQPDREAAAEGEKAFKDLLTKYKNVKRLYFDGKSQIENLTGQVEQLQNAVANQRIAQSRTALDDNEYSTRFNRLNGAINNLAFNIRKDWRSVPQWLSGHVSPDALKTGKQEMTAVGRAVISRWLVEELFEKCFHPGLEPLLSAQLKGIELSIRGNAYTMHSQEEFTALTTKVVHWRMATLDGLQQTLNSSSAEENRQNLTSKSTTNLTAWLYQFLSKPPPPGVEGSTSMITELAVGIAANLPLESRDVATMYPLPGDVVRPDIMDVEKTELPALEVGADADSDSEDEKEKGKSRGEKVKSGMWTLRGGAPPSSRKGSVVSTLGATGTDPGPNSALPKDNSRVRFAGFMAWEVRGRQVLMKAPVWTV